MGWLIKDDIPYLAEYPELCKINDAPKSAWAIKDDLPFKPVMAELHKLDDAPSLVWAIKDDIPFKRSCAELLKINGAPSNMWIIDDKSEDPYKILFPQLYPPRKERKMIYKTIRITLFDYSSKIVIQKERV